MRERRIALIVAGVGVLVGLAGILSIGIVVLPAAMGLGVAALADTTTRQQIGATLVGGSAGALVIAWINRHGPGQVCHRDPTDGLFCADYVNPWPWLLLGAVAFGLGLWFMRRPRTRRPPT